MKDEEKIGEESQDERVSVNARDGEKGKREKTKSELTSKRGSKREVNVSQYRSPRVSRGWGYLEYLVFL